MGNVEGQEIVNDGLAEVEEGIQPSMAPLISGAKPPGIENTWNSHWFALGKGAALEEG